MSLWGKLDDANSKPKWLTDEQKAKCFFVSLEEAKIATNINRGITGAGWWIVEKIVNEYTGNIRWKSECLVSFADGINSISGDAADDVTVPDVVALISISVQPASVVIDEGDDAVFSVTAICTPPGNNSVLTYKWYTKSSAAGKWVVISGATANTLTVADYVSEDIANTFYRVGLNSTNGAPEVFSNSVRITSITPA